MLARQETADDGSDCSIEYHLSGTLKRPGLLNFDATDKREIEVFSRPKVFEPRPVLAGPYSTAVKTCCCFKSGRRVRRAGGRQREQSSGPSTVVSRESPNVHSTITLASHSILTASWWIRPVQSRALMVRACPVP